MNTTRFDYIIVGGGCAGLSLALSLSAKEPTKKLLIIESRQEYVPDRTWCFWNVQKHPFENLIEHRWKTWEVQWNENKLSLQSSRYEYQCISSERFYQATLDQLKPNPHVTFLLNTKVIKMSESPKEVLVETTSGVFVASVVYDSSHVETKADMFQHFLGWKVTSKKDVFNSDAVTLMDFDVDQEEGLNFMYVLPYSKRCALIESTYLSAKILPKSVYEKAIIKYLNQRYSIDEYEILSTEQGILPLKTPLKRKATQRIIPIGTQAGWARASTGYAFLAIQAGIENLLDSKSTHHKKRVDNSLDKIFVSYLQDEPKKGPELFFNLFKKNSSDELVRFLTSQWSYLDLLKIISSMPKAAMIKQALR